LKFFGGNSIIARYNTVYDVQAYGIGLIGDHGSPDGENCRIYHNTIYNAGDGYSTSGGSSNMEGGLFNTIWGSATSDVHDNVYKNNIVQLATLYGIHCVPVAPHDSSDMYNQFWVNNNVYDSSNNDVNYFATKRTMELAESLWPSYFYDNLWQDSDFTDVGNDDFTLQAGSPCIDEGGWLTTATTTTSGTSLVVDDARYFCDGYGLINGDQIRIGDCELVRITNVNYGTDTLTLEESRSWTSGDGVSLDYNGAAPDIGAHEYGGATEYTDTIRNDGIDYFTWMGANVTASSIRSGNIIAGLNSATENISIWDGGITWTEGNWLWSPYNGDGSGTDWIVPLIAERLSSELSENILFLTISGQYVTPLFTSKTAAGAASTRPGQIIRTSGNANGTWVWMSIYNGSAYEYVQLAVSTWGKIEWIYI